jgi:hypothetical protein
MPASHAGRDHVLLCAKARPWAMEVGWYDDREGRFRGWNGELLARDFTHWMPLPAPPTD